MADDPIEAVDPEEVARLERLVSEREAAEKLQPPKRLPVDAQVDAQAPDRERAERENTRELREVRRQNGVLEAPPAPLVPFISAEAVDQRLQAVSAHLQQIEAQTRHTMLLVMILGDRQRITAEEYAMAITKTQQAEAAARKES